MKKRLFSSIIICSFLLSGCGTSKEKITYDSNSISSETTTGYADFTEHANITETIEDAETTEITESQNDVSYEITYANAKTWTSYNDTMVCVIVEIENTGTTDLYLSDGCCDLEDGNGTLIAALTNVSAYPEVLSPGEKGYMYETSILDNYSCDGELNVLARPDIEKANVENIRYEISDVSLNTNYWGTIDILGRLTCTSTQTESLSYVVATFFDNDHIPIGISFTIISEDLNPNDKIGFEVSGVRLPEYVTTDSVADYTIYAYPMQFQ